MRQMNNMTEIVCKKVIYRIFNFYAFNSKTFENETKNNWTKFNFNQFWIIFQ